MGGRTLDQFNSRQQAKAKRDKRNKETSSAPNQTDSDEKNRS